MVALEVSFLLVVQFNWLPADIIPWHNYLPLRLPHPRLTKVPTTVSIYSTKDRFMQKSPVQRVLAGAFTVFLVIKKAHSATDNNKPKIMVLLMYSPRLVSGFL